MNVYDMHVTVTQQRQLLQEMFPTAIFSGFRLTQWLQRYPGVSKELIITKEGIPMGDTVRGLGYYHIIISEDVDFHAVDEEEEMTARYYNSLCMVRGGTPKHKQLIEHIKQTIETLQLLMI